MNPSEIRKELHSYVDSADNDSLKFFQEAIVAYRAKRTKPHDSIAKTMVPMTEKEFLAMIDDAESNIKNGKIFSQSEVEEKMANRKHARI